MITDIQINEFINDAKVNEALRAEDHVLLAKCIGREYCGFTAKDDEYIDLFWDAAFNDGWLYVTDQMVHEDFGYKKSKDMMHDFYKKIARDDYLKNQCKVVDKHHKLVKLYSGTVSE